MGKTWLGGRYIARQQHPAKPSYLEVTMSQLSPCTGFAGGKGSSLAVFSVAAGVKMNDGTVDKWSGAGVAAAELAAPFTDCSGLFQGKS